MLKKALDIFTPSKKLSLEEFERLYVEHKDFVRNSIFWMVGSEVANELTQDTFVKAWSNYSRFQKKSSFKTWIYAIAMNTAKDYLRKYSYSGQLTENHLEDNDQDEAQRDLIEKAIAQMSIKHREMFILFYKFEYTYREISNLTGVKEGTVKSRIQKSKEVFTTFLNEIGDENE
jgi:RNA polymerase sigma-70 factor (ECF subfamily)